MPPKHIAAKLLKTPAAASTSDGIVLCQYSAALSPEHRERYVQKISPIGKDPYLLAMSEVELPESVSYESIIDYALHKQSAYTGESIHCFKAVEAKQRYLSGMVRLVEGKTIGDMHVVRGRVMHSMRMTEPDLTPWIIIKQQEILSAHCDCTAGMGEVCSHVGAMLYHLTGIHHSSLAAEIFETSVTDVEQQWGRPSKAVKENLQKPLDQIDFGYSLSSTDATWGNVPTLECDSIRNMFKELGQFEADCSAMQIFCTQDYRCYRCTQRALDNELDTSLLLNNLYIEDYEDQPIERLRFEAGKVYKEIKAAINEEVLAKIEEKTRGQWKSAVWKMFRIGRITASSMKRTTSTKIEHPSKSLLKTICYPDTSSFSTQATRYGKNMEKVALNKLSAYLVKTHVDATISESGLIISSDYPEIAASPDGLLICSCCRKVPLEIKCPFKFKDEKLILLKLTKKPQPYIRQTEVGFELINSHDYYAQVQTQIALTGADYGYFYVWAKHEDVLIKVPKDEEYWRETVSKVTTFFKAVVLPELMGKYFTRDG